MFESQLRYIDNFTSTCHAYHLHKPSPLPSFQVPPSRPFSLSFILAVSPLYPFLPHSTGPPLLIFSSVLLYCVIFLLLSYFMYSLYFSPHYYMHFQSYEGLCPEDCSQIVFSLLIKPLIIIMMIFISLALYRIYCVFDDFAFFLQASSIL